MFGSDYTKKKDTTISMNQGTLFKKKQKKGGCGCSGGGGGGGGGGPIIKKRAEIIPPTFKNRVDEEEGFTNSISFLQPEHTNRKKTQELINDADNNVITQSGQLKDLQNKYNDVLNRYNTALGNMNNATSSYIETNKNDNDPTSYKNTNVRVNTLYNDPDSVSSSFKGMYKTDAENNGMVILKNGGSTYRICKNAAINAGYSVFGIQNAIANDASPAQCLATNDLTVSIKKGAYNESCIQDSDGNRYAYGNELANAVYEVDGENAKYKGCFRDSGDRAMIFPDINIDSYSPAYVLGQYGITAPWGLSWGGAFPDNQASWIWSSPTANVNAVYNIGSPITFVYKYTNSLSTYDTCNMNIICDDMCSLYINSTFIVKRSVISVNVIFNPGVNYIQVCGENSGGPAGFVLSCKTSTTTIRSDGNWKFTMDKPQNMRKNTQSYSVKTCRKYAKDNGYKYFGLQGGLMDKAWCMVSNDLDKTTSQGSTDQQFQMVDGNMYGGKNVAAVYQVDSVADKELLGKSGYLDENQLLFEYPATMVSRTKSKEYKRVENADSNGNDIAVYNGKTVEQSKALCDNNSKCFGFVINNTNGNCFLKGENMYPTGGVYQTVQGVDLYYTDKHSVKNNSTCNKQVHNIDTVQWLKYKNTGTKMTPDTTCGLSKKLSQQSAEAEGLKQQLAVLAQQIVDKISYLESLNVEMLNQSGLDRTTLNTYLKEYKSVISNFSAASGKAATNMDEIVADTTLSLNMENYIFIYWCLLALIILIITIYMVKSMYNSNTGILSVSSLGS